MRCAHKNRFQSKECSDDADLKRASAKQLASYIRRDKLKKRECSITLQDVMAARAQECVYCGRLASGLDRLDNSIGHVPANCVPACLRCNWMRGRYISHEVMLHVGAVLKKVDP